MRKYAVILLAAVFALSSQLPYREVSISPFTHCSEASILSPGGRYYVNTGPKDLFEVYDLVSDSKVFSSQYYAWTPPYPQTPHPDRVFCVFSPDEKFLITDNYFFRKDTAEPVHWAEAWDLERKWLARQFFLMDSRAGEIRRYSYNVKARLDNYYSQSVFRNYHPNPRVVFSPEGDEVWFLFPSIRIFTVDGFSEKNGTFNLLAVDRDNLGRETRHFIGAPFFVRNSGRLIIPIRDNTFVFNKFFDNPQDYVKFEGKSGPTDVSADGKYVVFGGGVYPIDNPVRLGNVRGNGYFSNDNSVLLADDTLYSGRDLFDRKSRSFYLGHGSLIPSSSREFLFIEDRLQKLLLICRFSTGETLQSIRLSDTETLFRDTDNGRRFIVRDRFTGKLRAFDRN